MQTSAYSAEYSTTGGGVINATTKSGTNDFHGTALWFNRNPAFAAAPFTQAAANRPVPTLKYNQFSLAAGGPVYIPKVYNGKNRTFWFAAFEPNYRRDRLDQYGLMPTDGMRQGDFSGLVNTPSGWLPQSVVDQFKTDRAQRRHRPGQRDLSAVQPDQRQPVHAHRAGYRPDLPAVSRQRHSQEHAGYIGAEGAAAAGSRARLLPEQQRPHFEYRGAAPAAAGREAVHDSRSTRRSAATTGSMAATPPPRSSSSRTRPSAPPQPARSIAGRSRRCWPTPTPSRPRCSTTCASTIRAADSAVPPPRNTMPRPARI